MWIGTNRLSSKSKKTATIHNIIRKTGRVHVIQLFIVVDFPSLILPCVHYMYTEQESPRFLCTINIKFISSITGNSFMERGVTDEGKSLSLFYLQVNSTCFNFIPIATIMVKLKTSIWGCHGNRRGIYTLLFFWSIFFFFFTFLEKQDNSTNVISITFNVCMRFEQLTRVWCTREPQIRQLIAVLTSSEYGSECDWLTGLLIDE